LLLLALPIVAACFHAEEHDTVADLPAQLKATIEKNDAYYLAKAKEQAVFTLNCAEGVTPSVVSTRPTGYSRYEADRKTWVSVSHATAISTIGVEGCGQRLTYQVLCGPHQYYHSAYTGDPKDTGSPCDVIPSSEAAHVLNRNHHEQQRLDDEAAAAAAAAARQPQQQQGR
jgi:hypothetical protein